ncbi:hypothetical protein AciX8_0532 [Granulicella mallensis MP5ACTX8]|uniref:Uncharacterized protein n=1 Tax=Granulicella mallensis (strain ATCC BAA-1857 / DSM 23137 / MP5ACTX8) TaxID=682795 RepID=G8NPG2_GRAMM|nr:hypothetical protein AciX8_0532 [Granulicella mallensis MP5ACTX8]
MQPKDPEGFDFAYDAGTFSTTNVQARALEVEKVRRVWAGLQISGSFDSASPKPGRFAQDDASVVRFGIKNTMDRSL